MAFNCRSIDAPLETVFEYLLDPRCYPRWLIGADRIKDVDAHWPQPGARFYHVVGFPPIKVSDHSQVMEIDAPRRLVLSVHATPLIRGRVTFTLQGDHDGTILCLQEEPERRLIGNLARPLLDPMTHVRNHRSLRSLARIIAEDQGKRPSVTPEG